MAAANAAATTTIAAGKRIIVASFPTTRTKAGGSFPTFHDGGQDGPPADAGVAGIQRLAVRFARTFDARRLRQTFLAIGPFFEGGISVRIASEGDHIEIKPLAELKALESELLRVL